MRLDAPMLARAWLAVRQATAHKDDNVVLSRTVAIEEHVRGVRLVSTDRYMLLTAWVPSLDASSLLEPGLDEAPERTVVAHDPDGRGKGLLGYVLQLARRQETDDLPLGAMEVRLDFDVKIPAGDDVPETFEGLEPVYATLTVPDVEKVYLPVVQAEYPEWRGIVADFTGVPTAALGLSPDLVTRVAGASKWALGPLVVTFGGSDKVMTVDYPESDPHIGGLLMPTRWVLPGEPDPADDDEDDEPRDVHVVSGQEFRDALHDAAESLGSSLREGESITLTTSDGRSTSTGRHLSAVSTSVDEPVDDEDTDAWHAYRPTDGVDPACGRCGRHRGQGGYVHADDTLVCGICAHTVEVSEHDPDASQSEIRQHVTREHHDEVEDPLSVVVLRGAEVDA